MCEIFAVEFFDNLAEIHNDNARAEHGDERKIVTDEEDREIPLLLNTDEQFDDFLLHGDVECTRRLIADENRRLERKGAGDADALTLTAAHVRGIAIRKVLGQIDETQQLRRLIARTALEETKVPQRLANDVLDLHLRVERRIGILKHHLDVATHIARLFPLQPRNLLPAEENLSFRRGVQLHQCTHERTLSAATLSDDAEQLPFVDGERHIVAGGQNLSARNGESLRNVFDAQDFLTLRLHSFPLLSAVRRAGAPWYSRS